MEKQGLAPGDSENPGVNESPFDRARWRERKVVIGILALVVMIVLAYEGLAYYERHYGDCVDYQTSSRPYCYAGD